MVVQFEPTAVAGAQLLNDLLEEFSLAVKAGPNDSLIVVKTHLVADNFRLKGNVFNQQQQLVENAKVFLFKSAKNVDKLPEPKVRKFSARDGTFLFDSLESGTYYLQAEAPGYLIEKIGPITLNQKTAFEQSLSLTLLTFPIENVIISASQYDIAYTETAEQHFMGQQEIERLSHLANDVVRAASHLPGVSGGDVSARIHIRGGTSQENLFLLDGMPLYEPFHLREAGSYFSTIDAFTVGEAQIITGGAPVEYGDHLSGVINLSTANYNEERPWSFGINFLDIKAKGSGPLLKNNDWFVAVRRGYLELIGDSSAVEIDSYKPQYLDTFAKLNFEITDDSFLSLYSFITQDRHTCLYQCTSEKDGQSLSNYHWLNLKSQWSVGLSSSTLAGYGKIKNMRNGVFQQQDEYVQIEDRLDWQFYIIKQDWQYQTSPTHMIKLGAEIRTLEAKYDYRFIQHVVNLFEPTRLQQVNINRESMFAQKGHTYAAYIADLFKLNSALTVEIGLRWDKQTYSDQQQLSPRINLDYRTQNNGDIKISWGIYQQAQPIHQLLIEKGIDTFFPSQKARQINVSYENKISDNLVYKLSAYQKKYDAVMPRMENILGAESLIIERPATRQLIIPQSAVAKGIEFVIQNTQQSPFSWWLSYALSNIEDNIDGKVLPRRWDQRHGIKFSSSYEFTPNLKFADTCSVNLVSDFHSGWRTSSININQSKSISDAAGSYLVAGLPNGVPYDEQFRDFFRVDLRVGCETKFSGNRIRYFIEGLNIFNRTNISGASEVNTDINDLGELSNVRLNGFSYVPIIPSIGFIWEF